jgi:hypothetical protein
VDKLVHEKGIETPKGAKVLLKIQEIREFS